MKSDDFIEIVDDIIANKYEKNNSCSSVSTVDPVDAMIELIEDVISGKKSLDDLPKEMRAYGKEIDTLPCIPRKPNVVEVDVVEIHERAVMILCEKMTGN